MSKWVEHRLHTGETRHKACLSAQHSAGGSRKVRSSRPFSTTEDGGQPGLQETCLKSKLVVHALKESNPCAILVDIISRTARTMFSDHLINTSKEVLRGE